MTILISLMSDTFLSRFQKRAERIGVKRAAEDQRYQDMQEVCQEKGPRLKLFPRKRKKRPQSSEKDVEQAPDVPNVNDDILREEVLEEVESIEENVDKEVDEELGIDKKKAKELDREMGHVKGPEKRKGKSPERQGRVEEGNDEEITEEDVERAIEENREHR